MDKHIFFLDLEENDLCELRDNEQLFAAITGTRKLVVTGSFKFALAIWPSEERFGRYEEDEDEIKDEQDRWIESMRENTTPSFTTYCYMRLSTRFKTSHLQKCSST